MESERKRTLSMSAPSSSKRIKLFDINDEDPLSNLPDDLVITVFDEFDFDQLDVMGRVSRKMCHFSAYTKHGIEKEKTMFLTIKQAHNGDFILSMRRNSEECFLMVVECNEDGEPMKILKKRCSYREMKKEMKGRESSATCKKTPLPAPIYEGIAYLLGRFHCQAVEFDSVLVDDTFMSILGPIFMDVEDLRLDFINLCLETTIQNSQRFLNWLVSVNVKRLCLSDTSIERSGEIYDLFIRKLAEASPNTDLRVMNGWNDMGTITFSNAVPIDSIAKFADFRISDLSIDMGSLVEIVKMRFNEKRTGTIYTHTSTHVDDMNELIEAFGRDFEIENKGSGLKLRDEETRFTAEVDIIMGQELCFRFKEDIITQ